MPETPKRRLGLLRPVIAILLIALFAAAVAACGGGGSSSGSETTTSEGAPTETETENASEESAGGGLAVAEESVAEAEAPLKEFEAPGPAFDVSKAKGKKIAWISFNASVPFTKTVIGGFEEAAKAAGVEYSIFDGKSDPNEYARGVQQAISEKADLIMLQSIPAELVEAPLKEAESAGIPVVESFDHEPGEGPTPGVTGEVTYNLGKVGQIMANFATADSGGEVDGVIITSSDVGAAENQVKGITAALEENCEGCKSKTIDVPTSQWEQKLAPATRAAVQDQSVNYLFPLYDSEVSFVSPAVIEAGAQERVGVISFNATPGIVEALADPNEPLVADVGSPPVWTGWAFADQAFRILAGGKPIEDEKLPYRLFTKENSAEINFEEPEEKWYGTADFKGGYEELWGL